MSGSEQPTQESLAEARKWITTWLAVPGVTPCNATAREEDFAALLDREKAKAALAEADWWEKHMVEHGFHAYPCSPRNLCVRHKRRAALEQAVSK